MAEIAPELDLSQLSTYLNDHLAGSVAALELIEHIAKNHPGTTLGAFLAELHVQVSADQDVLRDLLHTFEEKESAVRKAGAWVAEKMGRVKLGLSEHDVSGTGLLEGLDALALGITGKQMLWRTLAAAEEVLPELNGLDYAALEQRAIAQRNGVEVHRLSASLEAFKRVASE